MIYLLIILFVSSLLPKEVPSIHSSSPSIDLSTIDPRSIEHRSIDLASSIIYLDKFNSARYEISLDKKYRKQTCEERFLTGDVKLKNLSSTTSIYNIVAFLPFHTYKNGFSSLFSIEKVFPAVEIALEKIKNFKLLPEGHVLVFRYAEDLPGDHAEALNTAIQLVFNNMADMFLGPAFDYAAGPIARQARYWNMPLITAGAFASEIGQNKKDLYNMVIRVGATIDVLCQCILRSLVENNWGKVKLVRQPDGQSRITARFCQLAINGLHDLIKRTKHNISHDFTKFDHVEDFLEVINDQIGMKFSINLRLKSYHAVQDISGTERVDKKRTETPVIQMSNIDSLTKQNEDAT